MTQVQQHDPIYRTTPERTTKMMVIMLGIGCLTALKSINWQENDQIIVVVVLCIIVPITHSILNGFGISLIIYSVYHILKGNTHRIHPILYIIIIPFLINILY